MDHRTVKLEPWQLVPRPLTLGRLAFVNEDLWCTSTSRIDVLGRPKYSGICWTSLRNLETKTLSHNAIGTSWLTFVEIIHLQLPPKHHPLAVPWYPWDGYHSSVPITQWPHPLHPADLASQPGIRWRFLLGIDYIIHSIPLYLCTYHCTNRLRGIFHQAFKGIIAWSTGKMLLQHFLLIRWFWKEIGRNREFHALYAKKKHKIIIPGSKALPDALAKAQFPNKNSTRTFTASSKATP